MGNGLIGEKVTGNKYNDGAKNQYKYQTRPTFFVKFHVLNNLLKYNRIA